MEAGPVWTKPERREQAEKLAAEYRDRGIESRAGGRLFCKLCQGGELSRSTVALSQHVNGQTHRPLENQARTPPLDKKSSQNRSAISAIHTFSCRLYVLCSLSTTYPWLDSSGTRWKCSVCKCFVDFSATNAKQHANGRRHRRNMSASPQLSFRYVRPPPSVPLLSPSSLPFPLSFVPLPLSLPVPLRLHFPLIPLSLPHATAPVVLPVPPILSAFPAVA